MLSAAKGEALVKLCMVTWLIDIFLEITSVACLFVMYICAVLYVLFFASISGIRISQTGSCDVTSRCLWIIGCCVVLELESAEDLYQRRVTRILTNDFPVYFALVTRIRQETKVIGMEGGFISSTVVPQVQAVFPDGAIQKSIRVGVQVIKSYYFIVTIVVSF